MNAMWCNHINLMFTPTNQIKTTIERLVIGVDCSTMAEQAKEIVAINGFKDRITIIRGKVEEIELPVEKVRTMEKTG